jgi:hypothetical protein
VRHLSLDGVRTRYRASALATWNECLISLAGLITEMRVERLTARERDARWARPWRTDRENARRNLAAIGVDPAVAVLAAVTLVERNWPAIRAVAAVLERHGR